MEIEGRIICVRCRRDVEAWQPPPELIDLGIRPARKAQWHCHVEESRAGQGRLIRLAEVVADMGLDAQTRPAGVAAVCAERLVVATGVVHEVEDEQAFLARRLARAAADSLRRVVSSKVMVL